jgi:hypothetical protein
MSWKEMVRKKKTKIKDKLLNVGRRRSGHSRTGRIKEAMEEQRRQENEGDEQMFDSRNNVRT